MLPMKLFSKWKSSWKSIIFSKKNIVLQKRIDLIWLYVCLNFLEVLYKRFLIWKIGRGACQIRKKENFLQYRLKIRRKLSILYGKWNKSSVKWIKEIFNTLFKATKNDSLIFLSDSTNWSANKMNQKEIIIKKVL